MMTEREQLKAEIKAEIINEIQQNKSRGIPYRMLGKNIDNMIAKADFKEPIASKVKQVYIQQ